MILSNLKKIDNAISEDIIFNLHENITKFSEVGIIYLISNS